MQREDLFSGILRRIPSAPITGKELFVGVIGNPFATAVDLEKGPVVVQNRPAVAGHLDIQLQALDGIGKSFIKGGSCILRGFKTSSTVCYDPWFHSTLTRINRPPARRAYASERIK